MAINKLTVIILIFFSTNLFSQIKISGQINDEKNNPIEFIEIQLQNSDSIIVKSEITNIEGKFTITTEKGNYNLIVKQLGKIINQQKIIIDNNLNLGVINVISNQNQIKEVVITSKKKLIERKIDRLIFNVENSISASGSDALEALKITPGIRVQNETISMIGKSSMAVMVDDKIMQLSGDDLINYLKTISSDNIKSIEVITTPPAKYDAEGNSGLINIKLKKAKPDSWSSTIRSSYKQGRYGTTNLGSNFSYQKNKISLLADLSGLNGATIYENNITYSYPNQFWKAELRKKTNSKSLSSVFNLDYKINKKTKIGFQYLGNFAKPKENDYNTTNVYNSNQSDIQKSLNTFGINNSKASNHSLNFNLLNKFDDNGKQFTIDVDYFSFNNDKNNPFNSQNIDYITSQFTSNFVDNTSNQKVNNFSFKVDFTMPYKWANLEYGGKLSFTDTDSNINADFYDTTLGTNNLYLAQTNIFNFKENTQSLYLSSNKKIGKKWETKVGLRLENTQTIGFSETINQTNKNNYTKLFPTLYVSYEINDNNSLSFNASRRINRPTYGYLNPARWYQNLNSYTEGNPFLQPYYIKNFEFSHSYKDLFTTSISYAKVNNSTTQLTIHEVQNSIETQIFIRGNFYDQSYLSFKEDVNFSFSKWWKVYGNITAIYSKTDTNSIYLLPTYSGWYGAVSTTNTFTLNSSKTTLADCSFWYDIPNDSGIYTKNSISNLSFSVKKLLLDKKLTISLNANNILGTDRQTLKSVSGNVLQSFRQYYDSQYVRLSVSYKFGSSKVNVNQKKVGNQEEKQRTN